MDQPNSYEIFITTVNRITNLSCSVQHQSIIIITQSCNEESCIIKDPQMVVEIINGWVSKKETQSILFVSGADELDNKELTSTIQHMYDQLPGCQFALLAPYKEPPRFAQREDGFVRSFLVSAVCFRKQVFAKHVSNFAKIAYELLYSYLSLHGSSNVEIFQIGKKQTWQDASLEEAQQLLERSLLIIPHKGALSLLKRCLLSLNQAVCLPSMINICFDDNTYQKLRTDIYSKIENRLNQYVNKPGNVGPYLGRHFSILDTSMDYIFFQDSDDIPMPSRFIKQMIELERRDLDMIGSHELRMDEFERIIMLIRYPLEVNESLKGACFHALFHPTSIIRKKAYLKTGGFSTDLRFGYDSQFLLRSYFYLKLGNIDDFLYIRFKRPNSLTTAAKTKLGTNLRTFLMWRWQVDFKLIKDNKLNLEDSSLSVQKHHFRYNMIEASRAADL
jgi:hypothetical protein